MKNLSKKILISVIIVAIFLAPISAGIKINDKQQLAVRVEVNEVRAQTEPLGTCTTSSGKSYNNYTKNQCKFTGSDSIWTQNGSPSGSGKQVGNITFDNPSPSYFDCSGILPWNDIACKTASFLYSVLFVPMAAFTWLAAKILDFFVYYSTNSSSYTSEFVNKAWSAVRDIANIFFIIALLYVAIKTILGLNVTDNKKLISAVILVALIINFSLFTTKLIIDGSNILAKVFYNNIPSSEAGTGGQKSVSVGLVKQFDPQTIFGDNFKGHEGLFIFVTLLSILLMGFIIYIFLSVALLFVARVVSLWLSMIFSPISFASYTVPFDIPGFGHKEWWSDLIKNALLAPIFIFFLYIIILFGDAIKNIPYDISDTANDIGGYLNATMKTIIPFAIIFILLKKAKDLAVKYSGEIGAAINKYGAMAGGLALGAATGGAAMLGRTAIGGGGGYLAGQAAKGAEFLGLKRTAGVFKDVGKFAQKSSFDVRGVKFAGQSLGSITGMKVGEAQKGGWTEMKKKQQEKRQKRADELEKGGTGEEKKKVENAEIKLKEATLPVKLELENADRLIDKARNDLNDAAPSGKDAAALVLKAAKDAKETIRAGANGGAGLKILEEGVHKAKYELTKKGEGITKEYAEKISGSWSKGVNQVFRLGAYSRAGADEAARKIRTGTKLDSGEKPH